MSHKGTQNTQVQSSLISLHTDIIGSCLKPKMLLIYFSVLACSMTFIFLYNRTGKCLNCTQSYIFVMHLNCIQHAVTKYLTFC